MQEQPYSGVENLEVMSEARNYNEYLLRTVKKQATTADRILDFGAGGGQFAVPLSQAGFQVTALEPDDVLRSRIAEQGIPTVSQTQQLDDSTFDYIYTLNVLEHIDDDAGALRQLHSKLKSNGRLLIYVPAFPILYGSMDAKVGHVRRYTRTTLATSVTAAGFEIEDVRYVDSLGFFAALLFKFIGGRDGEVNRTALRLYDSGLFPLSRVIDALTDRWLGKNLLLIGYKTGTDLV